VAPPHVTVSRTRRRRGKAEGDILTSAPAIPEEISVFDSYYSSSLKSITPDLFLTSSAPSHPGYLFRCQWKGCQLTVFLVDNPARSGRSPLDWADAPSTRISITALTRLEVIQILTVSPVYPWSLHVGHSRYSVSMR
jgi:hypothetical protein